GDVHGTLRRAQQVLPRRQELGKARAAYLARKRRGGNGGGVFVDAKPDRVQALVAGEALEVREDARRRTRLHHLLERLLRRVGDQVAAHVEIAHEPARRQHVDERYCRVSEERQRDEQRYEEA